MEKKKIVKNEKKIRNDLRIFLNNRTLNIETDCEFSRTDKSQATLPLLRKNKDVMLSF